ncbi:hypothetical protein [Nocardia pneumoniae]|uniref:hypothetical protein n=1 Tax=Nocardia pneumoniae TaxID=228601 RepID=UPI00030EC359|nr:hypothetical protein [Nocardia pneumoniae]
MTGRDTRTASATRRESLVAGATPPYDAVIFDMDGVVTDTAALHAQAWKQLFDTALQDPRAGRDAVREPFDIDRDYRRWGRWADSGGRCRGLPRLAWDRDPLWRRRSGGAATIAGPAITITSPVAAETWSQTRDFKEQRAGADHGATQVPRRTARQTDRLPR